VSTGSIRSRERVAKPDALWYSRRRSPLGSARLSGRAPGGSRGRSARRLCGHAPAFTAGRPYGAVTGQEPALAKFPAAHPFHEHDGPLDVCRPHRPVRVDDCWRLSVKTAPLVDAEVPGRGGRRTIRALAFGSGRVLGPEVLSRRTASTKPNEIDAPPKEPINTTDLDSRLVRTLGRQAVQGCNA
jgi:hypothetical protein